MEEIRKILPKRKTPTFYRFVSTYQGYLSQTRDYGDGIQHNMIEMHILSIICENPGITVSQVAEEWGRTRGAASQNVSKLERQGLIVRTKLLNNAREVHLYPTKEGQYLAELHEKYDAEVEARFLDALMMKCSMEELRICDKVLEAYIEIMEKGFSEQ